MRHARNISFRFRRAILLFVLGGIFLCSSAAIIGNNKSTGGKLGGGNAVLTLKKTTYTGFSLNSGYKFRGTKVFSTQPETIKLHTSLYNSRNTAYISPQLPRTDLFKGKLILHPSPRQ